jgi:predicted sulfurtransferase
MTPYSVRRWTALLAVLALTAVSPAVTAAAGAEAPRLTAAEVRRLVEKGEALVVDVRGKEAYDQEHAVGAVSIPVNEIEARLKELPKNKLIAAYCT